MSADAETRPNAEAAPTQGEDFTSMVKPGDPGTTETNPPRDDVQDSPGDNFDFASLLEMEDHVVSPVPQGKPREPATPVVKEEAAPAATTTPAPVPAPIAAPEASQTTTPVPAQAPAPVIQEPVQPTTSASGTAPEPAAPAAPVPTQEELNAQYQTWFEQSVEQLAPVYALDEETKQKLDTAPSDVLPGMFARAHMQMVTAATTVAANLMRGMFSQLMDQHTENNRLEDAFYAQYDMLKPHKQTVNQIAKVFRSMYPEATPDLARDSIAAMAIVQLRLPPPQARANNAAPATVTTPVVPTSASAPSAPASPQTQQAGADWNVDEVFVREG